MSDEKKMFAQADGDAVEMASIRLLAPGHSHVLVKSYASEINAAVESERREAAVKALREFAKFYKTNPDTMSFWGDFVSDLHTAAAKIERGEQ